MKKLLIICIMIVSAIFISGCISGEESSDDKTSVIFQSPNSIEDAIMARWSSPTNSAFMQFFEDGTVIYNIHSGDYSFIDETHIRLDLDSYTLVLEVSISNNELTTIDSRGQVEKYIKSEASSFKDIHDQKLAELERNQEVASKIFNINVIQIIGTRVDLDAKDLQYIQVTFESIGSPVFDIRKLIINLQNQNTHVDGLTYEEFSGTPSTGKFQFIDIRRAEYDTILRQNDIIVLVLNPGTSMDFPPGETFSIEIKTEFDKSKIIEFATPLSYGTDTNKISLYP